jgi:hypothetical protein
LIQETYPKARFLWLVVPASLMVLSVLFLVITIVQTSRHRVSPWKDNALSVLFVNADYCLPEQINSVSKIKEVAERIGKRRVELNDGNDGRVLR